MDLKEKVCKLLIDNIELIEKKKLKLIPYFGHKVSTYKSKDGFLVIKIPEKEYKDTVLYIIGEFDCGIIYANDFSYFIITCGIREGEPVFVRYRNHDLNWNPILKDIAIEWNSRPVSHKKRKN